MSAGETEEIEQEVESVAEILRKPATESVQLDQVSTKLAELLEKDAIHKGEASRQFRGLVRKLLPVSIVSRLGDVRTAGLAAAAGPMIARMASTIAIMAIGDSDVTETLGARGAVPELLHSLTPSLRKQLKLEGQKAVMEAVSVLTISNEVNAIGSEAALARAAHPSFYTSRSPLAVASQFRSGFFSHSRRRRTTASPSPRWRRWSRRTAASASSLACSRPPKRIP